MGPENADRESARMKPKRRRWVHRPPRPKGKSNPGEFHLCPTCVEIIMFMLDAQLEADGDAIRDALERATGTSVSLNDFRRIFRDALLERARSGICPKREPAATVHRLHARKPGSKK